MARFNRALSLFVLAGTVAVAGAQTTKSEFAFHTGPIEVARDLACVDAEIAATKAVARAMERRQIAERIEIKDADPRTPNFTVISGERVPMRLNTSRIGVKLQRGVGGNPVDVASYAARMAGLVPSMDGHDVVNDIVLLSLDRPMRDEAECSRLLDELAKAPGVAMASPVFHNSFIEGGFYMPTDRILVRVRAGLDAQAMLARVAPDLEVVNASLGNMPGAMTVRTSLTNGFAAMRIANELAVHPDFKWATPGALESMQLHSVNPIDPNFNAQWAHENTAQFNGGVVDMDMDTDWAWDIEEGDTNVEILILDTGIQTTHPDLNWANGRDFTGGDENGTGNGAPSNSCDNHGTSVAGCAAERGNNIGGRGSAPGCRVMSGKIGVQQSNPCSSAFVSFSAEWLINALDWGRDAGCEVTNASIGIGQNDAVEDIYADTWASGVVHVASAGNGGGDNIGDSSSSFPGSAPFVMSISGLDPDGTLTSFSNFGTGCDACTAGIQVFSTDRTGSNGYSGNDYITNFTGTSGSAPLVAGVAGLIMSHFPHATPSQVRDMILSSCMDLGAAGDDNTFNNGFVNAYSALREYAPDNDFCGAPRIVDSNNYTNSQYVTWATTSRIEPNESCVGTVSRSVFYRFTAPNTGLLTVSTLGTPWDTVISVFDGCVGLVDGQPVNLPDQLACNDDYNGTLQSRITNLPVEHGQTVLIKVAAYGEQSGSLLLDFNLNFLATAPSNDICSSATTIDDPATGAFNYNPPLLDTDFATAAACESQGGCGAQTDSNSVWYRFRPDHDGVIFVNTFGSDYDTVVSIHGSCAFSFNGLCLPAPAMACSDDYNNSSTSRINFFGVNAGQWYYIKVADRGGEGGGLLDFNLDYLPSLVSNDTCTTARTIPSSDAPYSAPPVDVFYAESETCENLTPCDGTSEYNSVWYRFVAPANGTITADTFGSDYDTVLALYPECAGQSGSGCFRYAAMACNDNTWGIQSEIANYPVVAGQDYFFKVTGFSAPFTNESTLQFNFDFNPLCPADWNGDGSVDGDDVIAFFADWDESNADVNDDGGTDGDDVIVFFNHWDSGC